MQCKFDPKDTETFYKILLKRYTDHAHYGRVKIGLLFSTAFLWKKIILVIIYYYFICTNSHLLIDKNSCVRVLSGALLNIHYFTKIVLQIYKPFPQFR